MLSKFIPSRLKIWLTGQIKDTVSKTELPITALKYIPYEQKAKSYRLSKSDKNVHGNCESGLAIPPPAFRQGLSNTIGDYLSGGKEHAKQMLDIIAVSGFSFSPGDRILDMGCGAGRMMRHLYHLSGLCEIWGTDIDGPQVTWAKRYLNPPFHLATTTTIPHMPFEDKYFNFIYCGSVFTHIDDLAEAWLCELKRIIVPGGMLYVTIHDNNTIQLLETKYKDHWFAQHLRKDPFFDESKGDFDMLVLGRDTTSNVFYDLEYFTSVLKSTGFTVLSVNQEAYAYQTAVLVKRN